MFSEVVAKAAGTRLVFLGKGAREASTRHLRAVYELCVFLHILSFSEPLHLAQLCAPEDCREFHSQGFNLHFPMALPGPALTLNLIPCHTLPYRHLGRPVTLATLLF